MRALFEAIYAKYNGSDVSDLVEGLYLGKADEDITGNYIVFDLISDVPNYTFNSVLEEVLIQFNIFTDEQTSNNAHRDACDIYDALKDLFDECRLSVKGYNYVDMERELSRLISDIEDNSWQYWAQYRVILHKQR